jgi:hypothetical protein
MGQEAKNLQDANCQHDKRPIINSQNYSSQLYKKRHLLAVIRALLCEQLKKFQKKTQHMAGFFAVKTN